MSIATKSAGVIVNAGLKRRARNRLSNVYQN